MLISFKELITADIPTIVLFYSNLCISCQMMEYIIKDVKEGYGNKVQIYKLDIEKNQRLTEKLKIVGVPTLQIYKKGILEWNAMGIHKRDRYIFQIEKLLEKADAA